MNEYKEQIEKNQYLLDCLLENNERSIRDIATDNDIISALQLIETYHIDTTKIKDFHVLEMRYDALIC